MPDTNTLALDRTALADERTYAAWIRTGQPVVHKSLDLKRAIAAN